MDRRAKKAGRRIALLLAVCLLPSLLTATLAQAPASALTTATKIVQGGTNGCAVMADNNAYCWGLNQFGEIGDGTTSTRTSPTLVTGSYAWASITTRVHETYPWATTCGVTTAGAGYCWGLNDRGQLGDGTTTDRHVPTLVSGSHTWASISAGPQITCGVTTGGAGYCWGESNEGALGGGPTPSHVPQLVTGGHTWTSMSVGGDYVCGVTTVGDGYCWGWGNDGRLGAGPTGDGGPYLVSGGHLWASIVAGTQDTCGVTTAGDGYCWGSNSNGQTGNGNTTQQDTPVAVSGGYKWSEISTGQGTACGITTTGVAYCWGYGNDGALGDGTNTWSQTSPVAVAGGHKYSTITTGWGSAWSQQGPVCALELTGIVYCWGNNDDGEMVNGTTVDTNAPTEASFLFAITSSQTVSATVDPSFLFTVAGRASVCNGQSSTNFQTGTTATAVSLGHLSSATVGGGAQDLTVATNAANGFVVYVRTSGTTPNSLRDGASHSIADVTGTNASPGAAPIAGTAGFGYTSSDASTPFTSDTWAKLTNTNDSVLIGSGGTTSKSACIGYEVAVASTTPAGSYSSTIVYTAVPAF